MSDLVSFLDELEAAGELVRIGEELSTRYEVAAAIKLVAQRRGSAVLCEKVKGYTVPVVGNLLGSTKRLVMALHIKEDRLSDAYLAGRKSPIKPRMLASAPVQEVVINTGINISKTLPVLVHHQKDAGPYITCAFSVAKDPETGIRGLGIHRVQVKGEDKIGIFLANPPLSHFWAKAEQQGKPLEIAIVSGPDPVTYFVSPQSAPTAVDKYDIASGLAGAPIELVKCKSVDLEVPAQAQFVLEGYIIPHRRETEGPFGESTGYYFTYNNPVAKIKVITHRRNPVYHALVPFGPEYRVLKFPSVEIDTLSWLQGILPSVRKVYSPNSGVVYVQIDKQAEEDVDLVIDSLFSRSGSPWAKIVVVVDTDVEISDPDQITWALASRVRPDRDITVRSDLPGFVIDPSSQLDKKLGELSRLEAKTAKIGIDATKPLAELDKFEKADVPAEVKSKIARILNI